MILYKINIIDKLKQAGYNTNRIRQEKILSENTLQRLRTGEYISLDSINVICKILNCQPGELLEYKGEE